MKKYLLGSLVSLLLLGGVVTATAQGQPVEDVVLTGDGVTLTRNSSGSYVIIIDGNPDSRYLIGYTIDTSSPEDPTESALCLKEPEEASETELPMHIPGDYPNGMYTVSSCNTEDPELTFQLYIAWDVDGDRVPDDVDECPDSDQTGDLEGTVEIEECDSGVNNVIIGAGCTISDQITACADEAENHGEFVSCVSHLTNGIKPDLLTGSEKGAIQSCAAQSSIGGLPCESCEEDPSGLGQNRHRARYELFDNDLVIPCVDMGGGQYLAVDMNLSSATSENFHFKVKKAEIMTQAETSEIVDPEGTCAHYDLLSNSLLLPSLKIGLKQWQVQMKLLGANSVNLHFKLQSITEVQ